MESGRMTTHFRGGERVIRVGSRQESLDGEENCSDLKCWTPLVLEDVQADPTQLVNVRVVDPGDEPHLGCRHGIVLREKEFQFELASLKRGFRWPCHFHMEISCVRLIRDGNNTRHWFL